MVLDPVAPVVLLGPAALAGGALLVAAVAAPRGAAAAHLDAMSEITVTEIGTTGDVLEADPAAAIVTGTQLHVCCWCGIV